MQPQVDQVRGVADGLGQGQQDALHAAENRHLVIGARREGNGDLVRCYLENVGQVSQVEDVVKAYGGGEEVLADLLMQTDRRLGKKRSGERSVRGHK